ADQLRDRGDRRVPHHVHEVMAELRLRDARRGADVPVLGDLLSAVGLPARDRGDRGVVAALPGRGDPPRPGARGALARPGLAGGVPARARGGGARARRPADRQVASRLASCSLVEDDRLTGVLGVRRVRAVTVDGTDVDTLGVPARTSRSLPALPPLLRRLPPLFLRLRRALTQAPGSAWRDPVTWTIAALAFGAYFVISLFRLLRLTPGSYDLGIFTEYVKQLSQLHAPVVDVLGPGFNLLGNHFQVALGVLAPFFRVFPSAGTLLFFQALLAAVS